MEKISTDEFLNLYKSWGIGFLIDSGIVSSETVRGKKFKELMSKAEIALSDLKIYLTGLEFLLKNEYDPNYRLSKEEVKAIKDKMDNL